VKVAAMDELDIHKAFLGGEPIPGISFVHNDYVSIVAGEHRGTKGSLVNVYELGHDPTYIVENEAGFDIIVYQSHIRKSLAKDVDC